ncbi:lipopolysaccharide-induced tumor necrosis factor-alpha factor homolog isoform X2 [Chironomus tepperi]|uniref:lipopolysaccharide-induced tumor necrosis factor-alpha factor homolog isoform X2 n=1 Tax=Chironomus tepperi TaxID=113505 RepID=UPI00391EFC73
MDQITQSVAIRDESKPPSYNNVVKAIPTQLHTIPVEQETKPNKPTSPATTIIVQQMHPPCYGPESQNVTCPSCKSQITTKVKDRVSFRTHAAAYLLCLIGCWSCCLIPYCVSSCQNQMHICPNCDAYLGIYKS